MIWIEKIRTLFCWVENVKKTPKFSRENLTSKLGGKIEKKSIFGRYDRNIPVFGRAPNLKLSFC